MNKERRNNLRSVINECRKILEDDIARRISYYGIGVDGKIMDITKLNHLSVNNIEIRNKLEQAIEKEKIGGLTLQQAVARYIRHVGFTYLNRFSALRAMEVRGLIKETIIRRDKYHGRSLREMQLAESSEDLKPDELLKRNLISAFEEVSQEIKVLFDVTDSYSLVFPEGRACREIIKLLSQDVIETDWLQDDIIGWIYQYYNEKIRDEIRRNRGGKPSSEEIPIMSQFYTPDWIVRAIVDNTLGSLWASMSQGSIFQEVCKYYAYLKPIKFDVKQLRKIKVLDPACGSGHFLVYAFDLLYHMYKELAHDIPENEITSNILQHNLHGIDVDLRAAQLAALSLYLKAKKYNPDTKIDHMNIVCADIRISNGERRNDFLQRFADEPDLQDIFNKMFVFLDKAYTVGSLLQIRKPFEVLFSSRKDDNKQSHFKLALTGQTELDGDSLVDQTSLNVKSEQSSLAIVIPKKRTIEEMLEELRTFENEAAISKDIGKLLFASETEKSVGLLDLLTQKYDVIIMNPPHGDLATESKEYIKTHYPRTYYDYYSAFLEQAIDLANEHGLIGALTGRGLLVIKTMQKLRQEILLTDAIPDLILDLGFKTLEEANARFAALIVQKRPSNAPDLDHRVKFFSLFKYEWDDKRLAYERAISNSSDAIVYTRTINDLMQIPGMPYTYWAPKALTRLFRDFPPLDRDVVKNNRAVKVADVKVGLQTGDDRRFKRFWWEVKPHDIAISIRDTQNGKHWVVFADDFYLFYFYGNLQTVVNWHNDGAQIKSYEKAYPRNMQYYFKPGLTWSAHLQRTQVPKLWKTRRLPFRYLPEGTIFGVGSMAVIPTGNKIWALLSICCSKLIFAVSRTIASENKQQTASTALLPICIPKIDDPSWEKLSLLSKEVHDLLRDWSTGDEVSTDFIKPWVISNFDTNTRPITNHPLSRNFKWSTSSAAHNIREVTCKQTMSVRELIANFATRRKILDRRLDVIYEEIDNIVYGLYGISENERIEIEKALDGIESSGFDDSEDEQIDDEADEISTNDKEQVHRLLSFYGRQAILSDEDGIMPLSSIFSDNLIKTILQLFARDFGTERVQEIVEEFQSILGASLEEWYEREFFLFHLKLYRRRPTVWQLTSGGLSKGKNGAKSFSCFIDYQKLTRDTIPKIQGQYLPSVIERTKREKERILKELDSAKASKDKNRISRLSDQYNDVLNQIDELQAFDAALTKIHNPRDDKTQLTSSSSWVDRAIAEVRDNGYRPVIDYGIRVNIEPLKELKILHLAADKVK